MSELQTRDLTENEALRLTGKIREKVTEIWPLIVEAFEGRIWVALGLPSWSAYCDAHLRGMVPAIDRAERQQRVAELRDSGMSTRAIGTALGVDHKTVVNDIRAGAGGEFSPPEQRPSVVGLDGKTYTPPAPKPASVPFTPPPPPISAEEAEERRQRRVATDLLTDLVNSLSLLAGSDETFERYTPEIAHPWPINAEMLDKADTALRKTRATLTRKGIL